MVMHAPRRSPHLSKQTGIGDCPKMSLDKAFGIIRPVNASVRANYMLPSVQL